MHDHPGCVREAKLPAESCHLCFCGSGKLLNLPGAQFAYLRNGDDQGAYLVNSLGGLNEVQVVKCPASDWRLGIGSATLAIGRV